MAPRDSMQFGWTLERLLYQIRFVNPRHGPVYISKVDLADGFYRFGLALSAVVKLGVIFPKYDKEEQLIAFPLVAPMGWGESPPAFCAGTETVADLANLVPSSNSLPPHPLEKIAATPPPSPLGPSQPPDQPAPPDATAINAVASTTLLQTCAST